MKQTKKERTQKEIIEAAKEIIHEKGHEAVTVRHLAEITGYSYTNLYYYFKDLNDLLWVLRLEMIEDMITELNLCTIENKDPVEEIFNVFYCYMDYFYKCPNVFRFFYLYPFVKPDDDDRYEKLDERFQRMRASSFVRLVKEGIIKSEDIEVVTKTIVYALIGRIVLSFSSNGATQRESVKEELRTQVKYLFNRDIN